MKDEGKVFAMWVTMIAGYALTALLVFTAVALAAIPLAYLVVATVRGDGSLYRFRTSGAAGEMV